MVQFERPYFCQDNLVVDLIDEGNRQWKRDKLNSNFCLKSEVDAICSLPIGGPSCNDELVWFQNKDGKLTLHGMCGKKKKHLTISKESQQRNLNLFLPLTFFCVEVVKCNCNASYDPVIGEAGVVVIICNEVGQIFEGNSRLFKPCLADVAEAIAIIFTVKISFSNAIF
ncbi:hypothetical protein GQ457_01G036080 [Hibiscus cannabinus]